MLQHLSLDQRRQVNTTSNNLGFRAWIRQQKMMEHGWMNVSGCIYYIACFANCMSVERVHWLCAKAQFEQWMEEQDSIHNEADWIPTYFHSKAEAWKVLMDIAAQGVLKGHEAYASYQMYAWEGLSRSSTNSLPPIKNLLVHHYDVESLLNS
jgi:hypothetical protein